MKINEVLKGYIEATNSHEFSKVAEYIAEDAVYWFTKNEYRNLPSIQSYFENTWDQIKDEVYSISNVEWIANDEKVAVCLYQYQWEGYFKGEFVSGKGNGTNVFKKIDSEWKLVHEHLSPLS